MNKGFVSLTLVITISSLLLAFTYMQSIEIAHFFDMTRVKELRYQNYYNAYSCIDQVILNIAHDYFYTVASPISINNFNCVIDSVGDLNGLKIIQTHSNYKNINVYRSARVRLYDNRLVIELLE